VPVFGVLFVRNEKVFATKFQSADAGVQALRSFCYWIAVRMVSRPGLFSLIAVVFVASLATVYANLQPRYRLADQVPDKQQAVAASGRLDAKLTGANPVNVLIQFPKGETLYSPETLQTIADVHSTVERTAGVGNVWSLETLRRWLAEKAGSSDVATLKEYVNLIPEHLVRRFIDANQDAVVVAGRVPDLDSSQILPVVDKLDHELDTVRKAHPGYEIAVTGLSAIAARNSASMIEKLNRGLTIEFALVAMFIGLAFRSWVVMFACILPGIFPVVLSGTVLYLLGEGLQFASVVALTVSFGLGLSATIHFLNRLRLERTPGVNSAIAVERATVLVGPALILTTVVLACGLVVTVFSDLPSLRLFGWLSAFSMISALFADLFILRPTAMFLINLSERISGPRASEQPKPQL
jgi:predicted RND superfamily exporter protein